MIHVYCRGEHGETFLIRDSRCPPSFYVARDEPFTNVTRERVALRAIDGTEVDKVILKRWSDLRDLRSAMQAEGIPSYEADLRPSARYTIQNGLKGALKVLSAPLTQTPLVYLDPSIEAVRFVPKLKVLSFDIETTMTADRVLSIALHGCGEDRVLVLAAQTEVEGATAYADERALLAAFSQEVLTRDPDVITGWNVIDFDLQVLQRRAKANQLHLRLGRDGSGVFISEARSFWNASSATITGRVVLDGMAIVRNSFVQMEELSLEYVAQKVLGEGKLLSGPGRHEDLQRLYMDDQRAFIDYNMQDARLVTRIIDKLGLMDLAIERSLLTGMPLDRVSGSIASLDSLYLPELHKRGFVAPSVSGEGGDQEPNLGGLVLEPKPGMYDNVLVVDFKSLYPSIMRTFQIDPLGNMQPGEDAIVAPNGARFAREPGILPGILNALFPAREDAKRRKNEIESHAIKILMNSLYGVLGSSACRFFSGDIANAITGFGREILLWTKGQIESTGRTVLYGDTDSLFILNGDASLVHELNTRLSKHIAETWRVESKLELEYDTLYKRLFLTKMRQSEGGARKRYAGLTNAGELVFTGMEVVRRDWTELAKLVQRELYDRLFNDRPLEDYLRAMVQRVLRGELDDLLVYKKALRKSLESYTASTPPHVAAARKQRKPNGRLISYVITLNGPEPSDERQSPIDRQHYVEKQIRPVAEPVLDVLGLNFEEVAERPRQLKLF